jgi:hypothetical protein
MDPDPRRHRPGLDTPCSWRPRPHETYFLILGDGRVHQLPWRDTAFDHHAWQFGNCFRQRTSAEHARQAVCDVLHLFQQAQEEAGGG